MTLLTFTVNMHRTMGRYTLASRSMFAHGHAISSFGPHHNRFMESTLDRFMLLNAFIGR